MAANQSMTNNYQNAVAIITKQESKFLELVNANGTEVQFKTELLYAAQVMMSNDYLCSSALRNPLSLRTAFSQVAASGLTLDPSRGFAYLVPRDSQVVLDISFRGMIKAAVNDGAIRDCIVEVVYSKDEFKYQGKRVSPIHVFNPFQPYEERGELIGAYVEVLLPDGRTHVEAVPIEEILKARDASEMWKRKKAGPWKDFFISMVKKSAIKSARKYWPQSSEKLDKAIHYLNTEAQEGFANHDVPVGVLEKYMGAANVVEEPTEPLPNSNEESSEIPTQAEPSANAGSNEDLVEESKDSEANEVLKGELVEENPTVPTDVDLPPRTIKKVAELVKRARNQKCWQAAKEYLSEWPTDARNYALKQLQAAEYKYATDGE